MNKTQIEYRNRIIRTYIKQRNWDKNEEYILIQNFIVNSSKLLPEYPFVVEYEWEVESGRADSGKGDLVFTDAKGNFAVVEVKYLDKVDTGKTASTKRTQKRKLVKEQSVKYASIYSKNYFVKSIKAFIFTNENPEPIEITKIIKNGKLILHKNI